MACPAKSFVQMGDSRGSWAALIQRVGKQRSAARKTTLATVRTRFADITYQIKFVTEMAVWLST